MNQWCITVTETDFFRACRPSAFRGLQAFRPFRPSAVLPLTVTCARFGVWSLAESGVSSQQPELSRATTAAAGPPGHGWSFTHNSQIGSKSLRKWQCDNVTMWQQQRTNRTIFPCPCKNCSVTAVRHIGHASASFQCFSTTANTVSQFIRLSQRPQLEPIPKARKRKRAVRSVCDCIMCSFSVVCDRYTNTSVTVTVTVTESLL